MLVSFRDSRSGEFEMLNGFFRTFSRLGFDME